VTRRLEHKELIMKKLIPVLIILGLALSACGNFPLSRNNEAETDSDMATRVAELLATMTTPTVEMVFPDTPTPMPLPATEAPPEPAAPTATQEPLELPATETPLVVEETLSTDQAGTPTATAAPALPETDPARKLGNPTSVDPLDSYEKWAWPTSSDDYLKVNFKDGYLEMTGLTTMAGWRLPMISQQTNTYIELTVNSGACQAKDSYGIIFRVPVFKEPTQGYLYEVTCDGYLRLWEWNGKAKPKGEAEVLINWKESTDIKAGANQVNRLGVMTVGKSLRIYVNGVPQGEVSDSSYPAGFFGAFVRSVTTSKYTVKFDEMKYWENPAQ